MRAILWENGTLHTDNNQLAQGTPDMTDKLLTGTLSNMNLNKYNNSS